MKTRPYIELRRESIARLLVVADAKGVLFNRAAIGNRSRRVDNPPQVYNLPHIFQG